MIQILMVPVAFAVSAAIVYAVERPATVLRFAVWPFQILMIAGLVIVCRLYASCRPGDRD